MNINNNDVYHIGRLPMTNYIVPFCFDGQNFAWVEFTGPNKRNICIAYVLKDFLKNNNSNIVSPYKKDIDTDFGHISHLKIIDKSTIFLVHSLNICEIWKIKDNNFSLLESYKHIGDEVYAVDIYYNDEYLRNMEKEKESSNLNFILDDNNLNLKINKINVINDNKSNINGENINNNINSHKNSNSNLNGKINDETISKNENENENVLSNNEDKPIEKSKTEFISQKLKQNTKHNNNNDKNDGENKNKLIIENFANNESDSSEYKQSIENNFENNENKKKEKSEKKEIKDDNIIDIDLSFSIITLDIDGNVNLYQSGKENTLFNLYNFNDISQKMKNELFFSMGYEYYIKSNLNYFCISTDHGCFIIKKNF